MKPTLVILAAGMGSRYGGLKQLDVFGPQGETIIDYSLYDAILTGFGKIVFIIRESFRENFVQVFAPKLEGKIDFDFVCQELDQLPEGIIIPDNRTKPWGTAHAVYTAHRAVDGPFGVINADDFYGRESFTKLVEFFENPISSKTYCIVAYRLDKTLSDHGTVNRGICRVDENYDLLGIQETLKIGRTGDGRIAFPGSDGELSILAPDTIVSMNFFGFYPSFFSNFESYFSDFLNRQEDISNCEFYIPTYLDMLIQKGEIRVKVLKSEADWFGVTYQSDRSFVQKRICQLIEDRIYPGGLWG